MSKTKVIVERRKDRRFLAHDGVFVTLKPSDTHMGRVIDINMYGLAFEYVNGEDSPVHPNELEIFVSDSAFRLNKVPCQIIYELTVYESPLSSGNKKRCGVEFGELTPKQTSQLSDFIEHHTTGEV